MGMHDAYTCDRCEATVVPSAGTLHPAEGWLELHAEDGYFDGYDLVNGTPALWLCPNCVGSFKAVLAAFLKVQTDEGTQ